MIALSITPKGTGAAFLRARADAVPENEFPVAPIPSSPEPGELEGATGTRESQPRMIWYQDSAMKRIHRELVKAGMEQAREQGKRIGRPRVTERLEFLQRFVAVIQRIHLGVLSRRQAAKELAIGYATLKRLLDTHRYTLDQSEGGQSLPASAGNHCNEYVEVLN